MISPQRIITILTIITFFILVLVILPIFAPNNYKADSMTRNNNTVTSTSNSINLDKKFSISTRLRDTVDGSYAVGVKCTLSKLLTNESNTNEADGESWELLIETVVDINGTCDTSVDSSHPIGTYYKLTFYTQQYYTSRNLTTFYPYIVFIFEKLDDLDYVGLPIMMSPFTYSAYRGRRRTIY